MNVNSMTNFPRALIIGLLFVCCSSVEAIAQHVKLKFTDAPLVTILKEITNQSGYNFVYPEPIVSKETKISFTYEEDKLSIEALLSKLFEERPISFSIKGRQIALTSKEINPKQLKTKPVELIKGVVVDQETGEPIPGAGIIVQGTKKSVITDVTGKFSISVSQGDVLIIKSLGYKDSEVTIGTNKNPVIKMIPDNLMLDQIVVTGYQEVSKNQLTSAVAVVKAETISQLGSTSIEQSLQGQVAGLTVINTNTSPGSAPKVRVRGTATLLGTAEPLWVLDGVILENSIPVSSAEINSPDFMETFNSAIGGISPNDIESITVLKDASATAIYGTRAANGVIVVTTKKGRKNTTNISYRHSSRISTKPTYSDFNLLNSKERSELALQMMEEKLSSGGSVGMEYVIRQYYLGNYTIAQYETEARKVQEMNTDWFDALYRNAYTQTHDISISGGGENVDYYISLGYNSEQGQDIVSDYKNYNGMAKVNSEIFKGVKLGSAFYASKRDRNSYHSSINPFNYAASTARTVPLYNEDGTPFYYNKYIYSFNILNELNNTSRAIDQIDLKANITLDIDLFKGLKYSGLFSFQDSETKNIDYAKENTYYAASLRGYNLGEGSEEDINESKLPYGGTYNEQNISQKTLVIRNTLEYNQLFANDKLSLFAMLGQEYRSTSYTGLMSKNYGYMHDRGNIFYNPSQTEETYMLYRNTSTRTLIERDYESYFSILTLSWQNKYVLNGNIRFDGSNLFGSNPKYRYLPLWSVSGKWILSNEDFLADNQLISNLALRCSYGLRGNIVEDSSPQIIASALPPNSLTGLLEMEIIQPPNPDLKWETTSSLNIGAEFGMFKNRLLLNVDYFRDYSRDLIAYNNISAVSGFLGKYVNYADVSNNGVDISVMGDIIRSKKFTWTVSLNAGYVKNRVEKSTLTPTVDNLVKSVYTPGEVVVGKPLNSMWAYKYAGLDDTGRPTFYTNDGNIITTDDEEMAAYVIDIANLKYMGTREPIYTGGFSNTLKYKNLSCTALFSFAFKGVVRLPSMAYISAPSAETNVNRTIMDRWRFPGDEATKQIPGLSNGTSYVYSAGKTYYTIDMFNNSDYTIVPGDFIRLRSVSLEYRIPKKTLGMLKVRDKSMSGLSIKVQAQNLFVIADKRLKGYDPETINYTTNSYGSLPLPKTFTVGLNINF
jgi:TonB-linked SusC/RagA family outer membrane protein